MKRIPLKSAFEFDGLTKWRKYYNYRSGELKFIKNKYRKRFRKQEKEMVKDELKDD